MKKASIITIEIPVPCTVDLNEMQNTSLGKFCTHCQKEVIDAREYDAKSIHEIANKNPGHACMILVPEMLERSHVVSTSRNWWPMWMQRLSDTLFNNFYKKAGMFLGLNILLLNPAKAQIKAEALVTKNEDEIIKHFERLFTIHGQVLSASNQLPLRDVLVNVKMKGQIIGSTCTDTSGNFVLTIQIQNYDADSASIDFKLNGFLTYRFQEFQLNKSIIGIETIEMVDRLIYKEANKVINLNKKVISLNQLVGRGGCVYTKSVEIDDASVSNKKRIVINSLKDPVENNSFPRKTRLKFE